MKVLKVKMGYSPNSSGFGFIILPMFLGVMSILTAFTVYLVARAGGYADNEDKGTDEGTDETKV